MKKMPREILHIFCAVALAVAAVPAGTLAQEIVQETEAVMETVAETIGDIIGEMEAVVLEDENTEPEPIQEIAETELSIEAEVITETEVFAETEVITKMEEITETEAPELTIPETEVPETEIPAIEVPEAHEESENVEALIEKTVSVTSEVLGSGGEGDIFRLRCSLSGYEEDTYELQWQYMPTDWYGNHIGEWTDIPGANGVELDVQINETNALRAWRVVVNEK